MNAVLEAKYQQFSNELNSIWKPVGDIKQVPNALKQNLRVYMSKLENLKDDDLHPTTEREISKTIFLIKGAFKLIDHKKDGIDQKARAFLKRMAHDRKFEKTQLGAYRLRDAVTDSEKTTKKQNFRKIVCPPCYHDHRWGLELTRVQSQAELVEIGKKLDLCVQNRRGEGEIYHDRLYDGSREYWYLRKHSSAKALIEVDPEGEFDGGREIDEMQGTRGKNVKLEQEDANFVLKALDIVCYDPFIQLGAFLEFANGTFSYDDPDVIREDDDHIFHSWIDTNHVIVAKRKKESDMSEDEFEDEDTVRPTITLDEDYDQQHILDLSDDEDFDLKDDFEEDEESNLDDEDEFSNPYDPLDADEESSDAKIQWYRLNLREDPW